MANRYTRLNNAIQSGKIYRIKIYDKRYHYEQDPEGDGYVTYKLDPKDFNNNRKAIIARAEQIRKAILQANNNYKTKNVRATYLQDGTINVIGKSTRGISTGSTTADIENIIKMSIYDKIKQLPGLDIFMDGFATTMAIIGASKCGKSTLFRYIYRKYYEKNRKMISFLFTGSPHIHLYEKLMRLLIVPFFNTDCEDMIDVTKQINVKTKNHYSFLNIFDDILNVRYKRLVERLVMTDRNSNLSSIISVQDLTLIGPPIRANVNSFALFSPSIAERHDATIIKILRPYLIKILGKGATNDDMIEFFSNMTNDYGFIYLVPSKQHISFHRLDLKNDY